MQFRENPSLELGNAIFSKYLNQSRSELEVNVPNSLCSEIRSKLDTSTEGMVNTLSGEMFDKIQQVVAGNLSDTYSRFIFTSEFVKYKNISEILEDGLGNELE
jgi:hypothetical protein